MYLSDGDLKKAIASGKLIIDPPPENIDATSIDLHLDKSDDAKIWDVRKFTDHEARSGRSRPELIIGKYKLGEFGGEYMCAPPDYEETPDQLVGKRGKEIIVKPRGFLLWQTKEKVGTPPDQAELICFVDGKSTKARAGIIVHLTAPTIHSTWSGNITLEIANLGPFDLVLQENDVIAQLTVARITSPPEKSVQGTSVTNGQTNVRGKN